MPETKVVQILFSCDISLSHPWQMYYSKNVLTSNIVSHRDLIFHGKAWDETSRRDHSDIRWGYCLRSSMQIEMKNLLFVI